MYPSIFIYLKYFFNLKKFSIPCIQYIYPYLLHTQDFPYTIQEKLISYHYKWKINFKILRKLEKPWKLKIWKKYEKLGKIEHWNVPKEIEITHW